MTEYAWQYIRKNAAQLFEHDEFLELFASDLADILADNGLAVKSELQVFKSLIRWGFHLIKSEGKTFTEELMQNILASLIDLIRFENLTELEFTQNVLPLNILPAEIVGNRMPNLNHPGLQRNYAKEEPDDDQNLRQFQMGLETVIAEQFISNFNREKEIYNVRRTCQKLQAYNDSMIAANLKFLKQHENKLSDLEKLNLLEATINIQNQQLEEMKEAIQQIQQSLETRGTNYGEEHRRLTEKISTHEIELQALNAIKVKLQNDLETLTTKFSDLEKKIIDTEANFKKEIFRIKIFGALAIIIFVFIRIRS